MSEGGAALLERGGAPDVPSVAEVVRERIAPLVAQIDREGFYPAEGLAALGRAGAFASHLAAHTALPRRSLAAAIADMATVGATCMSTAFCVWCQDTCGWYLENTDNAGLRDRLQPSVAAGTTMGGTGLSNPIKALAGLEPFQLRGRRGDGGWIVNGVLPWVSNLGEGHWFGTVFVDEAAPGRRVMVMVRCGGEDGVQIRQSAHFVALEGTGTYSGRFRNLFVPDAQVLADPADALLPRIRPGFMLLQTGMGFGVIAGAVAGMRRDDVTHGSSNGFLERGADTIEAQADALRARVIALADTPGEGPAYLRDVLQARLEVSELTLQACTAGVLHAGAKGYLHGSAVERRQREGSFVAIITPSVRQLRRELALH